MDTTIYEKTLARLQQENRDLRMGIVSLTQQLVGLRAELDRILANMRANR